MSNFSTALRTWEGGHECRYLQLLDDATSELIQREALLKELRPDLEAFEAQALEGLRRFAGGDESGLEVARSGMRQALAAMDLREESRFVPESWHEDVLLAGPLSLLVIPIETRAMRGCLVAALEDYAHGTDEGERAHAALTKWLKAWRLWGLTYDLPREWPASFFEVSDEL